MPRRRRNPQGATYGSGPDLGPLFGALSGGLGGVDIAQLPEVQGPATAEQTAATGSTNIPRGVSFKPRTWFDRNNASRMQSDYNLGQIEENAASGRNINEANIAAKRAVDISRAKGAIDALVHIGAIPTERNIQQHDISVTPSALDAAAQGFDASSQASKTAGIKSKMEGDAALATAPDDFANVLAQAKMRRRATEFGMEKQPDTLRAGYLSAIRKPVQDETASMVSRIHPTTNKYSGTSFIDVLTGKPTYQGPSLSDQMNEMAGAGKGIGTGLKPTVQQPAASAPIEGITMDDLIIDPNTKQILGVKPRK